MLNVFRCNWPGDLRIFFKKNLKFFISLNVNNSVSFQIRLLFVIKKQGCIFLSGCCCCVFFFYLLQISEQIGELTI